MSKQIDIMLNENDQDSQASQADPIVEPVSGIQPENKSSQNFSDDFSVSNDSSKPPTLSAYGKPLGRPRGTRNRATELAPYHRKVRPVETEELLEEIFQAVYLYGVSTPAHLIAALRIPRYQFNNMMNQPNSKIRETIQDAIEAYETKIKQQYAEVLDSDSKYAMQFLSDENKRINRKYGEADILLQAQSSTYDNMTPDDLERMALEHVSKNNT